jgi:hypothetical protein
MRSTYLTNSVFLRCSGVTRQHKSSKIGDLPRTWLFLLTGYESRISENRKKMMIFCRVLSGLRSELYLMNKTSIIIGSLRQFSWLIFMRRTFAVYNGSQTYLYEKQRCQTVFTHRVGLSTRKYSTEREKMGFLWGKSSILVLLRGKF